MILTYDNKSGCLDLIIKIGGFLIASRKEDSGCIDHRPGGRILCHFLNQLCMLLPVHEESTTDYHQGFGTVDADFSSVAESSYLTKGSLVRITDLCSFQKVLITDLATCPSLNSLPENVHQKLISLHIEKISGK